MININEPNIATNSKTLCKDLSTEQKKKYDCAL